jgi:hypothetical protein
MDLRTTISRVLSEHSITLRPDELTQVVDLLRAQQNMLAVAWLQKGTGVSLPEAVAIVEAIDQVLKAT